MLVVDADPVRIRQAKIACDLAGHYARPDLFEYKMNGVTLFGGR